METKRDILQSVAAGDLTPEEAAERLTALDDTPVLPPPPPTGTLKRVRVLTELGTADVIGDHAVADAVADGEHTATREGDVLTIRIAGTEDGGPDHGRFRFASGRGRVVIGGRRKVVFGSGATPKVTVRMNPLLALDVEVGAGKLKVKDVCGPIKAEVAMGALRIEGARAPFEVEVAMGTAHIQGLLDHGEAKVRCDMGSATIDLAPGSSARVRARTSMGKVSLPGVPAPGFGIGGGPSEAIIGAGAATLEIECAMGAVRVTSSGGSYTVVQTP